MKVIFIKPNMISGSPGDSMEPLVFAVLASLTPKDIECRFYDERIESIPFEEDADLVALTVDVFSAKRSYQIAGRFRNKGIPVVLGGYHPSSCPDEAAKFADSIVIGDAEDTWPEIISDVKKGSLKSFYYSKNSDFGCIIPDRRIFRGKKYAPIRLIEFTRGCRFACDFCSIYAMYKGKIRRKSIDVLIEEINGNDGRFYLFTDDNFFSDISVLTEILDRLEQCNIRWSCQISADIIRYPEVVKKMAETGCISVTIGFESLERKNIDDMHKGWMIEDYKKIIDVFYNNGIMIYGTFILGYDNDSLETFDKTLQFAMENSLLMANFNPLIPIPGTSLYDRLKNENRLIYEHWWLDDKFRWGDCVFIPKLMNPEEFYQECRKIRKIFNSTKSIIKRFPGVKWNKITFYKAGIFILSNILSRKELYRKYGLPLGSQEENIDINKA